MICDCLTHRRAAALQFDRGKASDELAAYHRSGPGLTTRHVLAGLKEVQAKGTLLDIGSGMGALTFELLNRGIAGATCIDLAAGSIEVAREEAARRQLMPRIAWREGDFVELAADVPPADVVTLDKVVCCYPSYEPLLLKALEHSRHWLALSFPRDRWYVRLGVWVENRWRRLRNNAFRAFVHPVTAMDTLLRNAGFEAVYQSQTLFWQARIYARIAN